MKDTDVAFAILINLAKRCRENKKLLRKTKRKLGNDHLFTIYLEAESWESWNILQASKAIYKSMTIKGGSE